MGIMIIALFAGALTALWSLQSGSSLANICLSFYLGSGVGIITVTSLVCLVASLQRFLEYAPHFLKPMPNSAALPHSDED